MIVSISAVLLFGAISVLQIRARAVSVPTAFALVSTGFFLASTGAAGPIRTFFDALLHAISSAS
ncbi:hypothetical protein ACWCYY_10905 [Kitasatospora sp. NPDC001664]